jgi:uncharacterized membrane protein YtjA (UPF0391 family)
VTLSAISTARDCDFFAVVHIRKPGAKHTAGNFSKDRPLFRQVRQSVTEQAMSTLLKWALIMFIVSLVAALFGFTDLSAASADVARILFYIFLVIFLVLLVLGLTIFRAARGP